MCLDIRDVHQQSSTRLLGRDGDDRGNDDPAASCLRPNHSRDDTLPYIRPTSVILRLYNSSTKRVCKSFRNNNGVSLKAIFCTELLSSTTDSNLKLTV